MKILIINYRFFVSGGPERYLFNIMDILSKNGHVVIPFSVKHNQNVYSPYEEKYFLDPIGTGNETFGHEYKRNFRTIIKVFARMVYSFEAKKKLKQLIKDEKPDLVYVLQFQNKLSCSVIDAAFEMNVPIVQRISDFGHICIDNIFYHYQTNKICEKCLKGSKLNAVLQKCSNNSLINSLIKVLALKVHDLLNIRKKISGYVIPARFTVNKFIEFGVPENIIYNIPTFFNPKNKEINPTYTNTFLYIGRVDPDKGLRTLIEAFVGTPYKLIIIGFSVDGYDELLKDYLVGKQHNIIFTGKLNFNEMIPYLESCLCTICPSEWYDNFPNSVLESYAYKKPVIASNIGSLKELISNNYTGLHFEPRNVDSLRNCVKNMYENKEKAKLMGENGNKRLIEEYSSDLHYNRLMSVFEETVKNYNSSSFK
ncbi:glycosyltransferase family 4 protein [Flectobacillus sp. DC10W]|uniref:Glycosyltransferase family 4 protein n=1 Tax=Flectobacillus longus TaxID=2984207 RepID=A0ABT6YV43_9BACT|nr:glycosyltransferase family 4 protein [Flectobacillus longus]MDI9867400.1 glycosyltransferase family 4 protein [Flectobacillus longus]